MRWIRAVTNRSLALIVAFAVLACRGQDQAKRSTPNYQVVSEGSASGVTSTINGPGEKPAPVTDTNADTTTNFTLPDNPNPLGNQTAGASIAGTLPSYPTGASTAPIRRAVQPRTDTNGMASSSVPIVIDTIGNTTPPLPRVTRTKPRSDSDANTTTASSDTTTDAPSTTSTGPEATSTAPKKKTDRTRKPDDQQPPPPPPPADTTGTRG
jgi:hypothetical protein